MTVEIVNKLAAMHDTKDYQIMSALLSQWLDSGRCVAFSVETVDLSRNVQLIETIAIFSDFRIARSQVAASVFAAPVFAAPVFAAPVLAI